MSVKPSRKRSIYDKRKYWYHLSTTIKHNSVLLKPWDNSRGFNRGYLEPDTERICVAPSLACCLTALPYTPSQKYVVYRTKSKLKANPPDNVFDAKVTREAWIQKPTIFVKIGTLNLENVEKGECIEHVIEEAASYGDINESRKVFRWWRKKNLWKYLKRV